MPVQWVLAQSDERNLTSLKDIDYSGQTNPYGTYIYIYMEMTE